MKYSSLKAVVCVSTATFLLGYGAAAGAHTTGNQSLGTGKTKADIYSVSCDNEEGGDTPTFRLSARVRDNAPVKAPLVRITITKDGVTRIREDTNGDGNTRYSGWGRVAKGNGLYTVTISKDKWAAENYIAEMHCEGPQSSGYIHTSTSVTLIQNQ